MKAYSAKEIRNVAILGHSGCGKTTVAEAMLFEAGITKRFGKVDEGNTVSDYDQEEIRRKVSINSSIIPIEWLNNKLNFIDTPGYFDFVGEVKQALSGADVCLIVVSAKSGVEVGTEKAWEYATELNMPKLIFVNGMDDENADFDKVVDELREKFGKSIAPLQEPIKENEKFIGYVNVVKNQGRKFSAGKMTVMPVPDSLSDRVEELKMMINETVAETNEELMEKFFAEEEFTVDEIHAGLKEGIKQLLITPVICGAASQNVGIASLLNSLVEFLPSTNDLISETSVTDVKTGDEIKIKLDEKEPFAAFVFKTIADPYVGRLNVFKVLSGIVKKDSVVVNTTKEATEKLAHIYILRGKEQIEVDELRAGDIGAVAKLSVTGTQDSFCAKDRQVIIPKIEFPESLMCMAVVPKGKGDEDKISSAFSKIMEEDQTIKTEVNTETKQSLVYGIGDMHLDILVNKLKNKYKIEVDLVQPIIPFREMIKARAEVRGKYKKQSGGHGQYGDILMVFEPSNDLTTQYVFEEKIFGGSVPRQYFPAVEKGLQDSINQGVLAGYPVVGLKATLIDGSYHPVDSSEMAFKMAASLAFKEGLPKAKPVILEPIAYVEIIVPNDYTGDIMGDMNKRRGRILGMDPYKGKQKLMAEAPMSEIAKYPTDLRSMTQGRGEYTMRFERYEEAPMEVQQKIIAARAKERESEK